MKPLVAAIALVLAIGLAAPPAEADAAAPCKVTNLTQDTKGRSLKRMVQRSRDGDKLILRGTCPGTVVIRTDITIQGKGKVPAISGQGKRRAVTIKAGATVVLKRLRVQRGVPGPSPVDYYRHGSGIRNSGTLTLRNVIVRKNAGDGIWSDTRHPARLTLIGSRVAGNSGRTTNGQAGHVLNRSPRPALQRQFNRRPALGPPCRGGAA